MSIVSRYNNARRLGMGGLARVLYNRASLSRNRMYAPTGGVNRIGSAARIRAARSFTMNRRRKSGTSGIGVTQQHDSRLVYQKSSMSGSKKRRWKKFRGKVLAVSEKDLGTQQVVHNQSYVFTNTTSTNHCLAECTLYSLQSTNAYNNDLNSISGYIAGAVTTPGTGLAVDSSSKVIFQSGVLDITIRNASTNNGVLDSTARMEVDVYECSVKRPAEETGSSYSGLLALFLQNDTRTQPIGGGATSEINIRTRGCSPFDMSYSLSRFGIKIWRKTKYQISNNDQVTYQVRDPRRRSVIYREMVNQDGFNKPGWTRVVFIVGKLPPGIPVGPVGSPNLFQEVLVIGNTRKYTFKIENWSEDRTAYNTV